MGGVGAGFWQGQFERSHASDLPTQADVCVVRPLSSTPRSDTEGGVSAGGFYTTFVCLMFFPDRPPDVVDVCSFGFRFGSKDSATRTIN